jgi:hypothetical protein
LENALSTALATDRARSSTLAGVHGSLELKHLPLTSSALDGFRRDSILAQARTIVAPASGVHDDHNSKTYSAAKLALEKTLAEIVVSAAILIWKKKPRANSSFHEFESIVAGMRSATILKADAYAAVDSLIDSAHDPQAETSALSERVSNSEMTRRRAAIASMKQHRQALKQRGRSLVNTFCTEVDDILEGRIGSA